MQKPRNSWPKTANGQALLFFAQLMREMLSTTSFESFRVHSLDTCSRLAEALAVLDDIQLQRIPFSAFDPVSAELSWSLNRDPVASDLIGNELRLFDEIRKVKKGPSVTRDVVQLIHGRLADVHAEEVQKKIIQLFGGREKKDFRAAVASYCCLLINSGYSKQFLTELVEITFFSKAIEKVGPRSVKRFFGKLDRKHKQFRVFTAIKPNCADYLARLPNFEVCSISALPIIARKAIQAAPSYELQNMYVSMTTRSFDPYSAAAYVDQYLASIRSITFLARRVFAIEWSPSKFVMKLRSETGEFVTSETIQLQTPGPATARRVKALVRQTKQMTENFDKPSTERLFSSINTSALARATASPENQIISLWSAFEILLSDPPPNVARVVHYTSLITPCICLKYVRRYIVALCDGLTVSYRRQLKSLLDTLPDDLGIDVYTRFTHLVFEPQYSGLQTKLMTMCDGNPLARHRVWKLQQDFGNPNAIMKSLSAHQDRVNWQLHRIYRARNNLVHSGRMPPYIDSLVMNAFEYYQSAMVSILQFGTKYQMSDVDRIVREVGLQYDLYKMDIAGVAGNTVPALLFTRIYR